MPQTSNLSLYYDFPSSLPHQSFVEQLSSNMQTIDLAFTSLGSQVSSKAETSTFIATIPSQGWNGADAPYSIDVTVNGILATDNPVVDILSSSDYATAQLEQDAWAQVYRITTAANQIAVYAKSVPSVPLSIQLKVVR